MQENKNHSIDPRVEHGKTRHEKVNIASPRLKGLSDAKRTRMEAHLASHPNDRGRASRLAKNQ